MWYFLLEAGFEKLALNFLQQTWFWTFLKVQRSLSSTLLQNDCSKKIGLSSRGRACSKISAADVVLDLPQGEEVAKTSVRADHVESMKASGNLSIQPGAVSSQASVPARGLFQPGVVSRPGLLPSRRWFQAEGFSSQGRVFFVEGCSSPELVPARGLCQRGFCSSHGLVPAKGVSPSVQVYDVFLLQLLFS